MYIFPLVSLILFLFCRGFLLENGGAYTVYANSAKQLRGTSLKGMMMAKIYLDCLSAACVRRSVCPLPLSLIRFSSCDMSGGL